MRHAVCLLFFYSFVVAAQGRADEEAEFRKLAWQKGPTEGKIGDKATINVPEAYVFLDATNTRRFLELNGNPPKDGHYMFAPSTGGWWSVFSFNPSGYVKDDDKIDPDALLKSLRESDGPSNEERKRLGMEAIFTDGWQVPPHYDIQTKRLEWGVKLRTAGGQSVVNYTSRLLGRSGVTSAILVSDPNTLAADTEQFKVALQNFSYVPGERYAEFKSGDKMVEYGLAALVVGGAAAAAAKSGLLKSFGKFLWIAVLAAGAAVWALLKRFLGRKGEAPPKQQ